jgi:predicted PurR-regulated permease PerM
MTQRELVGRTVTVIVLVGLAWLVAWFVHAVADVLILLLMSAILASGFAPLVGLVERWRLPVGLRFSRGVAIFVLYLAFFTVVVGILAAIIVPAVREAAMVLTQGPRLFAQLRLQLQDLHQHYHWVPDLAGMLAQLPAELNQLAQFGPQAAGIAFQFVSGIAGLVSVLVMTYYMLLESDQIKRGFLALFPPEERSRIDLILKHVAAKFGGWLRGQFLLSFAVAAPVALGNWTLGMPFPALLGIIAGIGELIPMVGPTISAAVAILIALTQPVWRLIAVAALYLVILNVEPNILVPRLMAHVVGLSPLLTIIALLVGLKLLGILGGILAIPVAAALQVIVGEVVREIRPESPIEVPPPETYAEAQRRAAGWRRPRWPR